jgi:serine protease Do
MKNLIQKMSLVLFASVVMAPVSLMAQKEKDKEGKEKKEAEQIIITRSGDGNDKVVIELNGDKVTVNGKNVDDLKEEGVRVHRNKIKDIWAYDGVNAGSWNNNFGMVTEDANRAMLGVTTEKDAKGAEIKTISKDGGAEKAGLKKGDIITKIDDKVIEDPDDLSAAIRQHKPGDNVTVSYIREGKAQTVKAELGKWKGVRQSYSFSMPDMNFELPRVRSTPRIEGQNWSWSGGSPKLGLFIQDSEDGKGVKVIDVDNEGNAAKAGIKEDDVITEVDGKEVKDTDEMAKIIRDSKDRTSVKLKLSRKGKTETIEVKMPKKLKTADL